MIITEIVEINGAQYEHLYSDCGMKLQREEAIYDDVYNPIGSDREYIEVVSEEATEDDYKIPFSILEKAKAYDVLMGGN